MDRRQDDTEAHAHRRAGDAGHFARLHKRLDDCNRVMEGLIESRRKSDEHHQQVAGALERLSSEVSGLANCVNVLTVETASTRQRDKDLDALMRVLSRMNGFIGILWKPVLFVAVLGGSIWIWATGGKVP